MLEESIYGKGNGKNRGIDPLHKVGSKECNKWHTSICLDRKCGDPPMAASAGSVLSSCNSFPLSETCWPPREDDKLLIARVFKHHRWEVENKELHLSTFNLETS